MAEPDGQTDAELTLQQRRRVYLDGKGIRILDAAIVNRVDNLAWFDLQTPGLLVRITMTLEEIENVIDVFLGVRRQLREVISGPEE